MNMTRKEATRILQNGSWWDCLPDDMSDADMNPLQDALDVALSALRPVTREQVAEVWKGCDLCLDDSWQRILMIPKRFDHTNMLSTELAQFCPGCGRPLTDKAVDMVMERLEALRDE